MTDEWINWIDDLHEDYFRKTEEKEDIFLKGDNAIKDFCKVMTRIPGYNPYEYQLNLMNVVIDSLIPTFYWYIWQDHKKVILRRYGKKRIEQIYSSCASRRDGKSTFFQMVCVGLALCVPRRVNEYRYGIGLFSINLQGSKKMIEDIYNMLKLVSYPDVTIEKTKTNIRVYHKDGMNEILGFQTGEVSFIWWVDFFFHLIGSILNQCDEKSGLLLQIYLHLNIFINWNQSSLGITQIQCTTFLNQIWENV